MSRILDRYVSYGSKKQLLDEKQAARSVVVSNIPPQTADESVVIHFQRQKNGGGEIDHVHIPKKGTAIITFETNEVVETVIKRPHSFEGSQVQLCRFIPDDPPAVFQRVTARVNFGRLQLSSQESRNALKVLKDKTRVEYRDVSSKECVLYGTFNQIEAAHKLLQNLFKRRPSVQKSKGGNESIHHGDTVQTQQNSSETDTKYLSSFEVQPQFMKLLKRVYKKKLQEIEEEFCVKIVWSDNASQVQIRPKKTSNNSHNYQKGCDAFIDLYQEMYPNMSREVVELNSANDETLILEMIISVEAENDVVIEMVGNQLLVYAERNKITRSVQALKEKIGLAQGSNRNTRRGQRNTNLGAQENNETLHEDRFSALPEQLGLKQLLCNGVNFSLYQSDITDERVDAIVNAANDCLRHGAGVALAIVRKGGRQIEDESRRIMSDRNRRPLDVGDAVYTRGGHLSSLFVVHTVGPIWKDRERERCISLLRRACLESLRLAAQLELCSIALPAISSGIFGMPKDICAQVMFNAVEDFSSSTEAEFSTLRDVRIVIIDDETIRFFREEFVRRYTSHDTSSFPKLATRQERPSGEKQESSPTLNSSVKYPSNSSADRVVNPSDGPPKETREDNVASPNKGVGRNMENSNRHEQLPGDIENVHPSNRNIPDATKPPTDIETPNIESNVTGTNREKGLKGFASVKSFEQANKTPVAKPPSGRGRGILAVNFSGRPTVEVESKTSGSTQMHTKGEAPPSGRGRSILAPNFSESPTAEVESKTSGSTQLHTKGEAPSSIRERGGILADADNFSERPTVEDESKTSGSTQLQLPTKGEAKNPEIRRGRDITYTNTVTNTPPGLTVTDEGKRLARNLGERVKDDQINDLVVSMEGKIGAERNKCSSDALMEENQESNYNDLNIDEGNPSTGRSEDQTTSSMLLRLNIDNFSGSGSPPDGGITDPKKTDEESTEISMTGSVTKLPTDENTNKYKTNQSENETEIGQAVAYATSDEAASPEVPLHFNQKETPQATEEVIQTVSHESVIEQGAVEERQGTEILKTQLSNADPDAGPVPLYEMHRIHETSEPKCCMCINLTNDPIDALPCGHHFCKSCKKRFIEKTMTCPKCEKENLIRGNQPIGYMTWRNELQKSLPGYEECGTIVVTYNFTEGIQGTQHPNPGQPYSGLFCTAYLPDNSAGQELLNLLRRAFDTRLIFTIGKCHATGEENRIVWNGIELKTSRSGGPANCGYPDPSYLDRVKIQLIEKGISQLQDESLS